MRTRFAPAPTGWLHLGHVLNAQYVWSAGAEVLLRIEDHDRERCRPEYERGILDDLDWLGYIPDIFKTGDFRAGRCDGRQSDREAVYREAVDMLRSQGLVYACDCTRKDSLSRRRLGGGEKREAGEKNEVTETWYDGHCRDRGLPLDEGLGWRVRMDPGVVHFVDGRLGRQAQDPAAQCGDLLIRDRRGNWTYQFCVTVDDDRQGIDLVIRGEDLLPSTGRQIRLARLLGRERSPKFLHHPLVMKSSGQKLSKSDGDTAIRDLREKGWTPALVRALISAP